MAWYWIVLIVIGYFIIGGFFSTIYEKIPAEDYDSFADSIISAFIIVLWPITIPFLLAVYTGITIASKLLNKKK